MNVVKHIAGAVPILVRMLADQVGVKVVFGQYRTAATDSQVVWMPNLPPESEAAANLAFGYTIHEAGHIRFSDFSLKYVDELHQNICNILEDVRMEPLMCARYPGAKHTLYDLVTQLVAMGKMGGEVQTDDLLSVLLNWMLHRLRSSVLQMDQLEPYAVASEAILRQCLPQALMDQIAMEMFKVTSCTCEADVFALGTTIVNLLQDASVQQPKPQGGGGDGSSQSDENSEGGGAGQEGESSEQGNQGGASSSGASQPAAEGKSENQGEAEGGDKPDAETQPDGAAPGAQAESKDAQGGKQADNEPQGQQSAGAGDSTGQGNDPSAGGDQSAGGSGEQDDSGKDPAKSGSHAQGSGQGQPDSPPVTQEQLDAIKGILDGKTELKTDLGELVGQVLQEECDKSPSVPMMAVPVSGERGSPDHAKVKLGKTRRATNALRFQMDQMIEAATMSHEWQTTSGRKIRSSKIPFVGCGDFRVFKNKEEGRKIDTAIYVLLDRSTSMESRIDLASDACLSMALSLAKVDDAKFACAAFPGTESGEVVQLTDFGERPEGTADRYAAVEADGGTPMAEALLHAGYALACQDVSRRILMVVTDGQPDHDCYSLCELLLKRTLPELEIECLGLGIGVDVSPLFSISKSISQIGELPKAVFSMLNDALKLAA